MDGFVNISESTASSPRPGTPLVENVEPTMNPKGFIKVRWGVPPCQFFIPREPSNLLGPLSIRPKIACTPEVPVPSKLADEPGGRSNR